MSHKLIESAKALKDHAWLERFRKANYGNKYNELSPMACHQIAGYVDQFIDAVIAAGEQLPVVQTSDLIDGEAYWLRFKCGWPIESVTYRAVDGECDGSANLTIFTDSGVAEIRGPIPKPTWSV